MSIALAIIEDVPVVRHALETYFCPQPGFRCALVVRALLPGTEGVLLTTPPGHPEGIFQGLCAGAVGCFLKTTALEERKAGLLSGATGGSRMSPAVARQVIRFFQPAATPANSFAFERRTYAVVRKHHFTQCFAV